MTALTVKQKTILVMKDTILREKENFIMKTFKTDTQLLQF